jgi:hypothetical protein
MIGQLAFGLGLPALMSWMLYRVLSPARAIWWGDVSRVPRIPRVQPQARTYLPYLLWFVPMNGGIALFGLAELLVTLFGRIEVARLIGRTGLGLMFASFAFMLLHLFAFAFNRPRFLIAPAYRASRKGPPG